MTKNPAAPNLAERLAAERERLGRLEALAAIEPRLPAMLETLATAEAELARGDSAVARATERRAAARASRHEARTAIRELVGSAGMAPVTAAAALGIPEALCRPVAVDEGTGGREATEEAHDGYTPPAWAEPAAS